MGIPFGYKMKRTWDRRPNGIMPKTITCDDCKVPFVVKKRVPCLDKKIRCLSCKKKYRKLTDSNDKSRQVYHRDNRLRRIYDLSLEDYNRILAAQGGACAICGSGSETKLVVDHDHVTGLNRELLCDPCNNLLGRALDSPAILYLAIRYLVKHGKKSPL